MSARAWMGVAVGVLLALPVAGLLWTRAGPTEVGGWRRMPRLSPDEFLALPSFLRECQRSEDCDAPLVCFWDRFRERKVCLSSECRSDADCVPGTSCRWLPTGEKGTRVTVAMCSFEGVLAEGAPCVRAPLRDEKACERGLVCAEWCARSCGSWLSPACPEGFFCAEDLPEGPMCLPTCEGRACPEGQACVRMEGGVSVCSRVHGQDCQREACAAGQACQVQTRPFRPGEAWMRCAWPCEGEGFLSKGCPSSQSCMDGECWDTCSNMEGGDCAPDSVCVPISGEYGVCVLSPGDADAGT